MRGIIIFSIGRFISHSGHCETHSLLIIHGSADLDCLVKQMAQVFVSTRIVSGSNIR